MRNYRILAAAASLLLLSTANSALAEDKPDPVVATVGGVEIRESELNIAITNLDPQFANLPDDKKKLAALSATIDVNILSKVAADENLRDTQEYKQRMHFLDIRELHNAYFRKHVLEAVTDDEVKARYEKEVAAIPPQEEVQARHILVKTEDEAKAVVVALDGGKDFAELAKEKSTDPSKSEGGDLGYFKKGQMVPEFEAAAFALEKGQYTKTPVKSQFGFHVIKLEDKRTAAPPPLEQVNTQVRQLVMQDKYLGLLKAAKEKATVEIADPALKKGYDEAAAAEAAAMPK
jgi:peptidyl-prolyl cis-trans isomerase C